MAVDQWGLKMADCPTLCPQMAYWHERLYKHADQSDQDGRFWHDSLKGNYLEGKMGAREMTFAKGGGLPTTGIQGPGGTP